MSKVSPLKAISLLFIVSIAISFSGCAKRPLPWSRELDRKALKVFNEGQVLFNQGKYWSARRRYNKVISKFKRSRYADNASFMIGEISAAKDRYEEAVDEYHKVTQNYPASELLPLIAEKEYKIAVYYWDKGKKELAADIFAKVVDAYPFGSLAPKAQYRVADFYFSEKKDYAEAIIHYERLIENYPDLPTLKESILRLGLSYWEESLMWALTQDYTDKAAEQFTRIIDEFPESPQVGRAKEFLAKCINKKARKEYQTGYFYYWEGDYDAARLYYNSVLKRFADSDWAADALYDIGRTYYKEKKWLIAQEYFSKVERQFPQRAKLVARAIRMREKCGQKIVVKQGK